MKKKFFNIFSDKRKVLISLFVIHTLVVVWRICFVIYGNIDLQSEEAQYWMWSKALDLSYYSKPPMVAYMNYLSTSILGDTEIGVRINAILVGFFIPFIIFFFTNEIFHSTRKAFIASILVYAMPFFQGISMFFSTDTPLLFFWLLYLYLFWKALHTNKWFLWIVSGIILGLGLLSKYPMFFIIPVLFLYCAFHERKTLRNIRFYISVTIALICFLPVVIWSIEHDFINIRHVMNINIHEKSRPWWNGLIKLTEYIVGQLMLISPFFLGMYFSIFKKFYYKHKSTTYLLLTPVVFFLIFGIVSLTRGGGANINWTMFAYVTLPIILAHYIVDYKRNKTYHILFFVTVVLMFLVTHATVLDKIGLGKLFPPTRDPVKRIVGWQNLGDEISDIKELLFGDEKCFVFSNDYHIATEMSFYIRKQPHTYYANFGNRMTQFDIWKGIEQFENRNYNAIYIEKIDIGKRESEHLNKPKKLDPRIRNAFDELIDYRTHIINYREKKMYLFHIYMLKGFNSLKASQFGY